MKRYVSIWFRYLKTDWFALRQPELRTVPFVLTAPDRGRMVITAVNHLAEAEGIYPGMVLADAKAILSSLKVSNDKENLSDKLLLRIAEWCIRYTPSVAPDLPDGLLFDATGCSHLWGGEEKYLLDIISRFKKKGFDVKPAMADTIGAAWAIARYGSEIIVNPGSQSTALFSLPPRSLRIDPNIAEQLLKLGLREINNILAMPRSSLLRRFGAAFMQRLNQALGNEEELVQPIHPQVFYSERLPCIESISTRTGIEIALEKLLLTLTERLKQEGKGIRAARFSVYRTDGKILFIEIGTNSASNNAVHLFKLFEIKIECIAPGPGIELFILEAPKVEPVNITQVKIWENISGLAGRELSELLDRYNGRFGAQAIQRFLPAEHYWPERSYRPAVSLEETTTTGWKTERPRPVHLLSSPERIDVTAPIPDYPPMLFRYKNEIHKIIKADGPERIEQEWWLQQGEHRDYYYVEDEKGRRYWLFRLGHYTGDKTHQWYLHGFFS